MKMYFTKLKTFQHLVWDVDMKGGGSVYHSVVMAIRCDVINHMKSRTSLALKEAAGLLGPSLRVEVPRV